MHIQIGVLSMHDILTCESCCDNKAGGGGGGGSLNYLHAHIHSRFRHAHHETKDWLPSLGSRGRRKYMYIFLQQYLYYYWSQAYNIIYSNSRLYHLQL